MAFLLGLWLLWLLANGALLKFLGLAWATFDTRPAANEKS